MNKLRRRENWNLIGLFSFLTFFCVLFFMWPEESKEVKAWKAEQAEARKIEAEKDFDAKQTCGAWIKSIAYHPSTVDLHLITGSRVTTAPNGRRIVFLTFDAKNSFGLELRQTAHCLIAVDGEFMEGSIIE